jgi:hypothetical protein
MPNNKISPDLLSAAGATVSREAAPRASLMARVTARVRAGQFDRLLAVGVPAPAGSALAVHQARLTTPAEREAITRSLRQAVREARTGGHPLSSRIPINPANVTAAEDLIDAVTLRLHAPRAVSPRGMARLRQLLADGSGPLYRCGRGDLNGRLGAALAEL